MKTSLDIGKDLDQMVKTALGHKRSRDQLPQQGRPDRPDWLNEGITQFSEIVRQNVQSILDIEQEVHGEDGITRAELGRLMGLRSAVIYSILAGRNEIGSAILVRMSHALGVEPYLLLLPPDKFTRTVIPHYRTEAKRTRRAGKRAG